MRGRKGRGMILVPTKSVNHTISFFVGIVLSNSKLKKAARQQGYQGSRASRAAGQQGRQGNRARVKQAINFIFTTKRNIRLKSSVSDKSVKPEEQQQQHINL